MPYKRPYGGSGFTPRKRRRFSTFARSTAATRIQRAFRRRRGQYKTFTKKVNRAVLSQRQTQYHLFGETSFSVTEAPRVMCSLSAIPYDHSNPNNKWARTCPKIKLQSWTIDMYAKCSVEAPITKMVVQLVRHKRSNNLQDTDLQSSVVVGAPAVDRDNAAFLNCADAPNDLTVGQMQNNPFALSHMTNPKVIEVLKTWRFTLEAHLQIANAATPTVNIDVLPDLYRPVTYPKVISKDYYRKVNKVLKYPVLESDNLTQPYEPCYNNHNYFLICYSDYADSGSRPPTVEYTVRTSFRDID